MMCLAGQEGQSIESMMMYGDDIKLAGIEDDATSASFRTLKQS
jgi:hypothetical protein